MKRVLAVITCITALAMPLCGCSFNVEINGSDANETTQAVKQTEAKATEKVTAKATEKATKKATAKATEKATENPAVKEFVSILNEINAGVADGDSKSYVRAASSIMNWGVGTPLTTEQIKKETASFCAALGNNEKALFVKKMDAVYETYKKLLGNKGAENLLKEAGVTNAAYPWSTDPLETVEAVYQVVKG